MNANDYWGSRSYGLTEDQERRLQQAIEQQRKTTKVNNEPASKTPTWDAIQHRFSTATDTVHEHALTGLEFEKLRAEAKELVNEQNKEKAIAFVTQAGTAFGGAIVKALGPLLK